METNQQVTEASQSLRVAIENIFPTKPEPWIQSRVQHTAHNQAQIAAEKKACQTRAELFDALPREQQDEIVATLKSIYKAADDKVWVFVKELRSELYSQVNGVTKKFEKWTVLGAYERFRLPRIWAGDTTFDFEKIINAMP